MGQQTILRVETGNSNPVLSTDGAYPPVVTTNNVPVYETLDLYKSAPIKINKSYAEIQNIAKKNSDYSIPIAIPGSKKNNRFFETFYNVDSDTLYFDPTKRVNCQVLIDDVVYFKGYLKLNKMSIKENKVEYNVTLYSQLGELFGQMGNGLLSDLPYSVTNGWNPDLTLEDVSNPWEESPYREEDINNRRPEKYMFPIVHNGYVYDDDGNVATGTTRLYSSTIVGAWSSPSAAASAGATDYNLNSPTNGLFINQLKPALSVYHLFDFIFDFYGYTLKSDFKETPWFKQLYMYGYFANEDVLMGYKYPKYQSFPLSDVEVIVEYISLSSSYYATIVKKNTKVPCYCDETVQLTIRDLCTSVVTDKTITIEPFNNPGSVTQGCTPFEPEIVDSNVAISQYSADDFSEGPSYYPAASGTKITYTSGNTLNMNLVIDEEIKQIDFIASIAKKFNLIFTPDLEEPNTIIMEPIPYYMGSGEVLDWSGKLSYDQGFTVEPAQNYIESEIILSDKSDKDGGNSEFERIHNRVYGEKKVYSQTEFRSKSKKIETIFSPEVIRKWDVVSNSGNIDLPLGINYSESSSDGDDGAVTWTYEGLKSKPKLFYYVDNANPFINNTGELFTDPAGGVETFQIKISEPGTSNQFAARYEKIPIISHTSPIGADDDDKINNDSLSILFESERSLNVGVQAFDAYSKFDLYTRFYENSINNLFNKNTRFVKGKFNLNLDDILNIKPNDLIKLKEQYFQWNKIKEYNLTEYQLTDVELIQYNNVLQTYPTRYFNYYYLDNPSAVYRFKTEMTNEELNYTNWGRSVRYDYLQGANGTSNVAVVTGVRDFSQGSNVLVGQNWIEVTEEDYETNGGIDREYDSLYVYSISGAHFSEGGDLNNTFYPLVMGYSSGGTQYDWLNVYTDNADFNSKASSFGFTTGSSTTHGTITTPTPTPVPTVPAPTPTPYYNTYGALILTFNEESDSGSTYNSKVEIYVNGVLRDTVYDNVTSAYISYLDEGDNVRIKAWNYDVQKTWSYSLSRHDFTNDNENGDDGIKVTTIIPTITDYPTYVEYEFTVTLPIENCNYEYRIELDEINQPSPGACTGGTACIMEIDTTSIYSIGGGPANSTDTDQFKLPLISGGTYDFTIDWGDGSSDHITTWNDLAKLHTYAVAGTYTIQITGELYGWQFSGNEDYTKLMSLTQWGCLEVGSFDDFRGIPNSAFRGCVFADFTSITDTPYLERTPKLDSMFENTRTATIDKINDWDMAFVNSINAMFSLNISYNQDLDNWDTTLITSMASTFAGCFAFNGNVTTWNTTAVENMNTLFYQASVFNQNIGIWNTSNVEGMVGMFNDARAFDQYIGDWDVSKVEFMQRMFDGAWIFDQDISGWDTGNVFDMESMFSSAFAFNQDIGGWDVSRVNEGLGSGNMDTMFANATSFNQDLSGWCVQHLANPPSGFDVGATAWTLPNSRPVWGTCP